MSFEADYEAYEDWQHMMSDVSPAKYDEWTHLVRNAGNFISLSLFLEGEYPHVLQEWTATFEA